MGMACICLHACFHIYTYIYVHIGKRMFVYRDIYGWSEQPLQCPECPRKSGLHHYHNSLCCSQPPCSLPWPASPASRSAHANHHSQTICGPDLSPLRRALAHPPLATDITAARSCGCQTRPSTTPMSTNGFPQQALRTDPGMGNAWRQPARPPIASGPPPSG